MILAIDLDEHLIEVPLISGPGTSSAQFISEGLAELEAPFSDRFVGENDTTHSHEFFDIAKAQSEAEGEPHSVADDLSREAVAVVERSSSSSVHQPITQQVQSCSMLASLS